MPVIVSDRPTYSEVFALGEIVDDWPCDINPETGEMESNGGVEHVVEFGDKRYRVITNWTKNFVMNGHQIAEPIEEEQEEA